MNKAYKVTCPACSNEYKISKSIAHEMGLNDLGFSKCQLCGELLTHTYVPDMDIMHSSLMEENNGANI